MNPLTAIPAKARYYVYLIFMVAVVVQGALAVWYDPDPDWIGRSGDVLQYLGGALALTAASNITPSDTPKPSLKDNPLRPDEGGEHRL